jgi:hypothetical protein
MVGGDGFLRETDITAADPLSAWRDVPLFYKGQTVMNIVSFANPARVVVQTDPGWIFWGEPVPAGGYGWKHAVDTQGQWASTSGLAEASPVVWSDRGRRATPGIVCCNDRELGYCVFEGNDLVFHTGTITSGDHQALQYYHNQLRFASCANDRKCAYAWGEDSAVLFRTTDGGFNWEQAKMELGAAPPGLDWTTWATSAHSGGVPRKIGVSPVDPMVIAIGGLRPTASGSWGDTFVPLGGYFDSAGNFRDIAPHLHADVNTMRFDPLDEHGRRLSIATDGGVSMVSDWTAYGEDWRSDYNRYLTNLEFAGRKLSPVYGFEYDGAFGSRPVAGGPWP